MSLTIHGLETERLLFETICCLFAYCLKPNYLKICCVCKTHIVKLRKTVSFLIINMKTIAALMYYTTTCMF